MVSQLNQDPTAELTANSGHGTIVMEEDVESNAVEEKLIEDDTSCAVLDNSSGPDDLTWNAIFPISNLQMTAQWPVKPWLHHRCQ